MGGYNTRLALSEESSLLWKDSRQNHETSSTRLQNYFWSWEGRTGLQLFVICSVSAPQFYNHGVWIFLVYTILVKDSIASSHSKDENATAYPVSKLHPLWLSGSVQKRTVTYTVSWDSALECLLWLGFLLSCYKGEWRRINSPQSEAPVATGHEGDGGCRGANLEASFLEQWNLDMQKRFYSRTLQLYQLLNNFP